MTQVTRLYYSGGLNFKKRLVLEVVSSIILIINATRFDLILDPCIFSSFYKKFSGRGELSDQQVSCMDNFLEWVQEQSTFHFFDHAQPLLGIFLITYFRKDVNH